MATKKSSGGKKYWSARVTETSDALDIAGGTFAKDDPKAIARELERDAEKSTRRKSSPYRSAMSMLTFYINRAGKSLPAARKKILEDAKQVLREEFGPQDATGARTKSAAKAPGRKKTAGKKTVRKKTAPKKTARKRAA
jgi:hypothetical protein